MPKAKTKQTDRPKAVTKEGTIFEGVSCYVLNTGKRVLTKSTVVRALSGNLQDSGWAKSAHLERYIERLPNGSELLAAGPNVEFTLQNGGTAQGVDAETVARMLSLYADAWAAGALRQDQIPVAQRAAKMLGQLARLGIVALVDEATGYQSERPKDALAKRLLDMIREERDDVDPVYKPLLVALAPLHRAKYDGTGTPPAWAPTVANLCISCVWGEDGRQRLRALNPEPSWNHRDTQHLDAEGKKLLIRVLGIAEAYARIAKSWADFKSMMAHNFKGAPQQLWLS